MSRFFSEKNQMLKATVIGVVSAVVITAILMCILSLFFLLSFSMPADYLEYILLIPQAAGVLTGAYIAARILKRQGLIIGLIVSGIMFAAICIAGFAGGTESISVLTPIRAAVLLLCGALAGIKGVNRKEKLRIK